MFFSTAMTAPSASIQPTPPVPTTNISSIIAQQHPTRSAPWCQPDGTRPSWAPAAPEPGSLPVPRGARQSTQEAFGRILGDIAASETGLAGHILTTSPDVTVSTNLGPWVNRRGIFGRAERADTFREEHVVSAQR